MARRIYYVTVRYSCTEPPSERVEFYKVRATTGMEAQQWGYTLKRKGEIESSRSFVPDEFRSIYHQWWRRLRTNAPIEVRNG